MPTPRIPRFPMPALDLPPLPPLPAPGTRLSAKAVRELYDRLIRFAVQIFQFLNQFDAAWEAHYARHGRPTPPLQLLAPRRPRRRDTDA